MAKTTTKTTRVGHNQRMQAAISKTYNWSRLSSAHGDTPSARVRQAHTPTLMDQGDPLSRKQKRADVKKAVRRIYP